MPKQSKVESEDTGSDVAVAAEEKESVSKEDAFYQAFEEADNMFSDEPEETETPDDVSSDEEPDSIDSEATPSNEIQALKAQVKELTDKLASMVKPEAAEEPDVDLDGIDYAAPEGWEGIEPTLKQQAKHQNELRQAQRKLAERTEHLTSTVAFLHFKTDNPEYKEHEAAMQQIVNDGLVDGFFAKSDYYGGMQKALEIAKGGAALQAQVKGAKREANAQESGAMRRITPTRPATRDEVTRGRTNGNGNRLPTLHEAFSQATKQVERKLALERRSLR